MTLSEIKAEMASCIVEIYDHETGEIVGTEIDDEKMRMLQLALTDKINGVCSWIKDVDNSVNNISEEIKRLQARKQSQELLKNRLKNWLAIATEGENKKTDFYTVSVKHGLFVDHYDRTKIPDEYKREKVYMEPDTAKIKEAVADGKIISGVYLKSYSVTIR